MKPIALSTEWRLIYPVDSIIYFLHNWTLLVKFPSQFFFFTFLWHELGKMPQKLYCNWTIIQFQTKALRSTKLIFEWEIWWPIGGTRKFVPYRQTHISKWEFFSAVPCVQRGFLILSLCFLHSSIHLWPSYLIPRKKILWFTLLQGCGLICGNLNSV